jgi:hypothetical protein
MIPPRKFGLRRILDDFGRGSQQSMTAGEISWENPLLRVLFAHSELNPPSSGFA